MDITLYPGWNMVGLPSNSAGSQGLPAEVTGIGSFDATLEYNVAYSYDQLHLRTRAGLLDPQRCGYFGHMYS